MAKPVPSVKLTQRFHFGGTGAGTGAGTGIVGIAGDTNRITISLGLRLILLG